MNDPAWTVNLRGAPYAGAVFSLTNSADLSPDFYVVQKSDGFLWVGFQTGGDAVVGYEYTEVSTQQTGQQVGPFMNKDGPGWTHVVISVGVLTSSAANAQNLVVRTFLNGTQTAAVPCHCSRLARE